MPVVSNADRFGKFSRVEDADLDEFVTTLKTQVEIFINRMKSYSSRGRSIANDTSVQTLFINTMSMHSQLLKYIQNQEDRRVFLERLQDKLTIKKLTVKNIPKVLKKGLMLFQTHDQ